MPCAVAELMKARKTVKYWETTQDVVWRTGLHLRSQYQARVWAWLAVQFAERS